MVLKQYEAKWPLLHQFFRFFERPRMFEIGRKQATVPLEDQEEIFLVIPNEQNLLLEPERFELL